LAVDRRTVLQNAQLFASKGQYEAAITEWKKLILESPTDGSIFNSIGDLHLKRNANAEAITAYLQAAAAFRTEGSTLKAIAAYKKILKVDPARYEVYRHLGDLNAERGLLSSAVQDYLTLGKFYLKEGKSREALDIYRKIVTQDPSNLDAQQRVAELCVQENLQDEAIKVYLQLGRERSAQQRHEDARDAYMAVLRLDSHNAEAKEMTGMLKDGGGAAGAAAQPQKSSSASTAKNIEPGDLLGEATRRMEEGQYAGAEAMLTQLLSREPGNPQICQLLARLHLLQGNLNVALGEYRFLAGAALRSQEHLLANSLIQEYLKVEPNSVPMLELFGELCEEKGDGAAAAQHFGRAVEILLEHPEPGMPTLPAELFEKVQALAPGSAIARKLAPAFDLNVAPATAETTPSATDSAVPLPVQSPEPPVMEPMADSAFRLASAGSSPPAEQVIRQTVHDDSPAPGEPARSASPSPAAEPVAAASLVNGMDAETRYALGTAYKDMGLLEEAKEEFMGSMKDVSFFIDSCLMLGLCLKEQEQSDHAIQLLEKVVTDSRCRGGNAQIVRYELGLLYEKVSARDRAIAMYQSIPSFHDVPQRLEALCSGDSNGSSSTAPQSQSPRYAGL